MAYDAHKNFAYSLVATAPSPAGSGTSLTVTASDGTKFPAVPFNATVWPVNTQPTTANAEIVRVTNIAGDVLTITRIQESTSARTVLVGDQIANTLTAKVVTDIETTAATAANITSGTISAARVPTILTTTSTGTQNNFNPGTMTGEVVLLRCNNASDITINGIVAGADGQILVLASIGAGNVILAHQNGGSTAANQLFNIATSGNTPLAAGAGSAIYVYDGTTQRWRLVSHEQGNFIAYTPTWSSVATAPVLNNGTAFGKYYLRGRVVTFEAGVAFGNTTSFGGANTWTMTLPAYAAEAANRWAGACTSTSNSVQRSATMVLDATTTFSMVSAAGPFNSTTPAAWVSTDFFFASGSYVTT